MLQPSAIVLGAVPHASNGLLLLEKKPTFATGVLVCLTEPLEFSLGSEEREEIVLHFSFIDCRPNCCSSLY